MIHKLAYIIIIIGCLANSLKAFSQSYRFGYLGIEQGLSNNYVNALAQDRKGRLWVGTDAGLNLFDGSHFFTYTTENSPLAGGAINTLLYDAGTDKLWIGSRTGLSIINCATGTIERIPELEKTLGSLPNITAFALSGNEGIWIAQQSGRELIYFNKKTGSIKRIPCLINGRQGTINSLLDDQKGHLYMGYRFEGLQIYDIRHNKFTSYTPYAKTPTKMPSWRIYCIFQDKGGRIWIGTDNGLSLFNLHTGRFTNYSYQKGKGHLLCNNIYDIKEMQDGTLWIASDVGGINILDLKNPASFNPATAVFRSIIPTYDAQGLTSPNIRNLLQDSFGNIWIGNHSKGINFIGHTHSPFHLLPAQLQRKPFDPFAVWGLYADGSTVWTGCENGLVGFNNGKTVTVELSDYLTQSHSHVFAIIRSGDDLLLGMYRNGLLRLSLKTHRIEPVRFAWQDINVNTFYKAPNNDIWIGTEFGIYIYRNGKLLNTPEITKLYSSSVYGILMDKQGKKWIGTYGSGIFILDHNNKIRLTFTKEKGFTSNIIHQFLLDSKGRMWVATKNGLVFFPDTRHPRKYHVYTIKNGLKNDYIRAVQEDNAGNIWISTDQVISCLNPRTQEFKHFDFHSGIPLSSFVDASVCKTSDGTIFFGSLNGVCYFNPNDLKTRQTVAPVQITACEVLGSDNEENGNDLRVPFTTKGIRLSHDQSTFRLSFSIPDYALNGMAEYAYMLEGNSDSWMNTQGESSVTFRNLPPGDYTFKVKARLKNQAWDNTHIATIKIHIRPPFYQAWYAWLVYLLLASGGVFFWLRSYKRKLQLENSLELERKKIKDEQNTHEERLRFFTNITHELRTPLTLIIGPLEDLTKDSGLADDYRRKTGVIYKNAIRLLSLVNRLLDFRKAETQNRQLCVAQGDLSKDVTETVSRFKDLNRNPNVQLITSIETKQTPLYYDKEVITTILNNLLSNALKYTPQGTITVRIYNALNEGTNYTVISVKDTGYGIDKKDLTHIFERYYQAQGKHQASGTGIGLALVSSLARLHECLLHVDSVPGEGSEFTLSLKTDCTYPDALHRQTTTASTDAVVHTDMPDDSASITEDAPQILIVEDNDDIRHYMADSLSKTYKVWQAVNGLEGVKTAKDKIPDIIISDIMMPLMDGIELCKEIKNDIYTSHIPVILLTAKDTLQDKEEGYENGADSYLTKPFSARLLKIRIQNLLESKKRLAARITENLQLPSHEIQKDELNRTSREFLEKLIKIIEDNIKQDALDIDFLTEKMNMSRSSLYRKIKGLTGLSGNEFIKKFKLKHCIKLMQTGMNISESAYASGFNDVNYFRICFKREFGKSPSEYLKQDLHMDQTDSNR